MGTQRKQSKATEFTYTDKFPLGYRAREDKTTLPDNVLITGSQNVLTGTSGRISPRKGFTIDGTASGINAGVFASYDWFTSNGLERNVRAGGLTGAANDGKLQFRHKSVAGVVTWIDLMTALTSVKFNFAEYWNNTNLQSYLEFVDGSSNIYEWSGGVTDLSSVTSTTITKLTGVETWAELGFYPTGSHTVVIDGIAYTATGGWGTQVITGVTPDPTLGGHSAGAIIHQGVETTANSAITSLPSAFKNDLISVLRNQIYIGSLTSNLVYVSKVNDITDFSFTSPVRLVGEGMELVLDGTMKAFIPQEDRMYMSAGQDFWYTTKFTLSADLSAEAFEINRLQTTAKQATQSQALTTKLSNKIVFVSNQKVVNTLGFTENIYQVPQIGDLSYTIDDDVTSYTYTNASCTYFRNFLYVAIPQESITLIYNMSNDAMTQQDQSPYYWESPQILPITRYAIIGGELYGHSSQSLDTFKMFTGHNDNGNSYTAIARFAYTPYGVPAAKKSFNQFYIEGYIAGNTTLEYGVDYDLDGCSTSTTYELSGSTEPYVCLGSDDNSLGKFAKGKAQLGGNPDQSSSAVLPPKFRINQTFPAIPFYEASTVFFSQGKDQQWELVRFGVAVQLTAEGNNRISR